MKVVKFILFTIIIFTITAGIPFFVFRVGENALHLSKVEGTEFVGPAGYAVKIIGDETATPQIKENAANFLKEYTYVYKEEKKDMMNLFLVTSLILGVLVIAFGIVLLKIAKYKIFSKALITSGILSIILYILMYVTVISTLPVN